MAVFLSVLGLCSSAGATQVTEADVVQVLVRTGDTLDLGTETHVIDILHGFGVGTDGGWAVLACDVVDGSNGWAWR